MTYIGVIPIIVSNTNSFNIFKMLARISQILSIVSFILSASTIGAGYFAYSYMTSPQFEAKMIEKVMKNVNKILPNQIDKKLPKVTGPILPL